MPGSAKVSIGQPIGLGQPYSYSGPLVVTNRSDRPLTLDTATLVEGQPGLSTLRAYIIRLPAHPVPCSTLRGRARWGCVHATRIGDALGFRIPWDGTRLLGARIEPHEIIQIVVGVKVTQPGRHSFRGVAVRYHDGPVNYRASYPYSGRLCAPVARYEKSCHNLPTG